MTEREKQDWEYLSRDVYPLLINTPRFIKELMSDLNFSQKDAESAVFEYVKFVFLAKHSFHGVVPSKVVDIVWHTHLLYTRHYWNVMCYRLEFKLHHNPYDGPPSSEKRCAEAYARTLESYTRYFGAVTEKYWPSPSPPSDISEGGTALKAGMLSTIVFVPVMILLYAFSERALIGLFAICVVWILCILLSFRKKKKSPPRKEGTSPNNSKSNDSGGWFPWFSNSSCSSSSDSDSSSGSSCGSSCSSSCGGGGGD